MAINEKFIAALANDPNTGGSIQRTGCGDADRLTLREIATAIATTAKVVATNSSYPDGAIYIGNATLIGVECFATFGSGALTHIYINPEFRITPSGSWFHQAVMDAGASSTLASHKYDIATTDEKYAFAIANPGANFMRIKISAAGTTATDSGVDLYISRGWGEGPSMMFK